MLIFARKNAIEATSVYTHSRYSASTAQAMVPSHDSGWFLIHVLTLGGRYPVENDTVRH